jgi:hypothetical protein
VVTWRRSQMVLLSAQGMNVAAIAKVAFTSARAAVMSWTPPGRTGETHSGMPPGVKRA